MGLVCNDRNTNYSMTLSLKSVILILVSFFVTTFIGFNIYSRNQSRKKDICEEFGILFTGSSELTLVIMVSLMIIFIINFLYFSWRALSNQNTWDLKYLPPIVFLILSIGTIIFTVILTNGLKDASVTNPDVEDTIIRWCKEDLLSIKLIWGCGIIFALSMAGGIITMSEWMSSRCVI